MELKRKLSLAVVAFFAVGLLFMTGVAGANAATYYYVGTGDDWNTDASWHSADKACDDLGDGAVPGDGDDVRFGASCDTDVTLFDRDEVASLQLESGYEGTVTLDTGASFGVLGTVTVSSGATLDLSDGTFTVSGSWYSPGTVEAGTSTVVFIGANPDLNGETFYNLTRAVTSADGFMINNGQTIVVTNELILTGESGALLSIESDLPGTAGYIDASAASVTVRYLSLKDNGSLNGTILCTTGCVNRGGTAGWLFNAGNDDSIATAVSTATLLSPSTSSRLTGGETVMIDYILGHADLDSVSFYFSSNGGSTFELIESELDSTGTYVWTVPNLDTRKGMLKVVAVDANSTELISDTSSRFFVEMSAQVDIDTDMEEDVVDEVADDVEDSSFYGVEVVQSNGQTTQLVTGSLFRGETRSDVYLVSDDGMRSVFPNDTVFASHGYSFDNVITVQDDQLSLLPLGDRITMAAGELVKIQSDDRVFEVGADGMLTHVQDEATALSQFGADWATLITDINVVFWGDYTIAS